MGMQGGAGMASKGVARRWMDDVGSAVNRLVRPGPLDRITIRRGIWKPIIGFTVARLLIVTTWAIQGSVRSATIRWDSGWYASVLASGYSLDRPPGVRVGQANIAFFPGYPVLGRGVSWLTGFTPIASLLLVTLVSGAVATCLVWAFATSLYGESTGTRACLLFCFATGAFAFSMLYSEAIFLCFAIASCWALTSRRYVVGGVLGAMAGLTRPTGIALIVACAAAVLVAERADRWKATVGAAISTLGVAGYLTYIRLRFGSWSIWFDVQHKGWGEGFSLYGARKADVMSTLRTVLGRQDVNWIAVVSVAGMVLVAAGIFLLIRQRGPLVLVAYSLAVSATSFTSVPIGFRPRMTLMVFPIFIAFGASLKQRWAYASVLVTSAGTAAAMAWMVAGSRVLTP